MAAKIEVNVALDDGPFAAFAQKFKEYQTALDKTPDAWKKVARSSEESNLHFEMTTAALAQQADDMAKLAHGMGGFRRDSEAAARHWHGLSLSTHNVAGNILSMTSSLMKWAGVTSLISGLAGVGGMMGFDSLGYGVASSRTAAMGLGATYGGRQSFLTNFDRLGDASGLLSRVNEIEHRADNIPLRALGLSQEESQGDTADVGANAILRLKKLVDGVKDPRFLQDTLHANRADELISLQQAQVLKGMSPKEVADMVSAYRRDKGKLGLSDPAQRKWQEFSTQMSRAGAQIENTFVKRLGALTPSLTQLSGAFAEVVDKLMADKGPLAHWLDKLDDGVEWLAKNIDTPAFQRTISDFIDGVGTLANELGSLLTGFLQFGKWLGISPAEASEGPRSAPAGGGSSSSGAAQPGDCAYRGVLGAQGKDGRDGAGGKDGRDGSFFGSLAQIESGNRNIYSTVDPDVAGPGTRSQGYFQINTPTWQEFAGRAGVNLGKYPNAMSAPKDVQAQVAAAVPFSRFGPRTRRMMQEKFGPLDTHQPVGKLGARFSPSSAPANTTTRITVTKPTGSDPNTAAAAAAAN